MSISNERSASLLQAQFRSLRACAASKDKTQRDSSTGHILTSLMRHGGAYTLLDRDMMTARLLPLLSGDMAQEEIANFVNNIGDKMASFFSHLVPTSNYVLDTSLISHISFPGRGLAYTEDSVQQPPNLESPIPAAFTFVGQFIDHDLTMNAVNLFDTQTGSVADTASPTIDLDSVYGPRTLLSSAPAGNSIYNDDGTFRIHEKYSGGAKFYDLFRDPATHKAYISDARNDENQMILQVHLLVMRTHNKLIKTKFAHIQDIGRKIEAAYLETLYNWQSVLIDDYLPRILYSSPDFNTLAFLLSQLKENNFGAFIHKPLLDLATGKYVVSMPHEFAIGFRFGHSQLKPRYLLRSNQTAPVPLFNNSLTADTQGNIADLRGSQPLIADHVIEWPFFAAEFKSNLIDGKVTSVVFDLPESAIPDDIKFVGNLIQRNLIRSSQVGLCSGEQLAKFYGIPPLAPSQIDAPSAWHLYGGETNFRTPLWYYLLKEAEAHGRPAGTLGKLGSRLVGEVILGAIAWNDDSVLNAVGWTSSIPLENQGRVTLLDLANFVNSD